RPFFMDGKVVKGKKRGLGIPTANLKTDGELMPREGVYATRVEIGGGKFKGATNIGCNPTFGKNRLSVETHILGFRKNIYGKKLRLYFIGRIRGEKRFRNPKELVRQIRKDIKTAKRIWRREKPWNL
ncbi:MAG: riboflavin kinase, partial [Deltaproteobacteria bacterium]|nr:riboflavin kinase [Deltaproteobacteria bacterium]